MKIVRRSLHYRQKIDVPSTDVDGNDSTGIKVSPLRFEGLPCKQVNRYRIAGECIDHQDVEPLILASRRFLFQQSPCISLYCVNPSIRVSEVSEYRVRPGGQINHGRIDFVISEIIAVPSVGGKRTRAQSDDSDAQASFSNAPFSGDFALPALSHSAAHSRWCHAAHVVERCSSRVHRRDNQKLLRRRPFQEVAANRIQRR